VFRNCIRKYHQNRCPFIRENTKLSMQRRRLFRPRLPNLLLQNNRKQYSARHLKFQENKRAVNLRHQGRPWNRRHCTLRLLNRHVPKNREEPLVRLLRYPLQNNRKTFRLLLNPSLQNNRKQYLPRHREFPESRKAVNFLHPGRGLPRNQRHCTIPFLNRPLPKNREALPLLNPLLPGNEKPLFPRQCNI
jgi:hypothetical protein